MTSEYNQLGRDNEFAQKIRALRGGSGKRTVQYSASPLQYHAVHYRNYSTRLYVQLNFYCFQFM